MPASKKSTPRAKPAMKTKSPAMKTKSPTKTKPATKTMSGSAPSGVTINLSIHGPGLIPPDDVEPGKVPKVVIKSELEKLLLNLQKAKPSLLGDQRRKLVSSMGCVSNPGGPGC